MLLATIIGLGIVALIFLYFTFNLSDEHVVLKVIMVFAAVGTALLIPAALVNNADLSGTYTTFFKIMTWFFRVLILYAGLYIVYKYSKLGERFQEWLNG